MKQAPSSPLKQTKHKKANIFGMKISLFRKFLNASTIACWLVDNSFYPTDLKVSQYLGQIWCTWTAKTKQKQPANQPKTKTTNKQN